MAVHYAGGRRLGSTPHPAARYSSLRTPPTRKETRMRLSLIVLALLQTAAMAAPETPNPDRNAPVEKPIRALLVIGGCCHDYKHQKDVLTKGISQRANVEWTIAYDPNTTTSHMNP